MSSGVRELRVWQESVALAGDVIRAIRPAIRRETKGVSDAVMETAISVACHIADGFARPTAPEQREAYLAAKRALLRLDSQLAIARHAELLPAGAFTELGTRSGQTARLLTGYVIYLDRQIADDAQRSASPSPRSAAPAGVSPDSGHGPS